MYLLLLPIILGFFGDAGASDVKAPIFPALFGFGDSIIDTGNNNHLLTIAKCNFPPYGKDFIGHQPTGRFSNGKVPVDFLASDLGIKETLPAYLNPQLKSKDLLTGVCFASGASGFDPLTPQLVRAISMEDQLKLFIEYKEKLRTISGDERAAGIISESLYVVCAGNNDMTNTYFGTLFRRIEYDIPAYAKFLVSYATRFVEIEGLARKQKKEFWRKCKPIQHLWEDENRIIHSEIELYNLGARKIAVVGLPPLGCLPSQRTIAGGIQRDCVSCYNQASALYNEELIKSLQQLRHNLPVIKINYVDIYKKLLDLIQNHLHYDFEESTKGCCGTGELEASILCNSISSTTCVDDSKYVFWDSFHPSEKAYEILTRKIIQEDVPYFF